MANLPRLDVITIGRASVDLYGQQIGGRLEDSLRDALILAAQAPLVRGFAIGRTIFAEVARQWLAGEIDDARAVAGMASGFGRLVEIWRKARGRRAA